MSSRRNVHIKRTVAGRSMSPQGKRRVAAWLKQMQLVGDTIVKPPMTNNIEDEPKYEKVFKGFVFRKFDKNDKKNDETEKEKKDEQRDKSDVHNEDRKDESISTCKIVTNTDNPNQD